MCYPNTIPKAVMSKMVLFVKIAYEVILHAEFK